MRLAQIEDGTVVNIAEADPTNIPDFMSDWVETEVAGPGWYWSLEEGFTPPQGVPELSPEDQLSALPSVSLSQMIAALVVWNILTEAEGEAWILGTLPEDVLTVISSLPPEVQFVAKLRAIRPSEVSPSDILVPALAAMKGKTTEDLIEIFRLAATL